MESPPPTKKQKIAQESEAKTAIRIKFIKKKERLDSPNVQTLYPVFTHQVFENERIIGHVNPKIELFFAADSMQTFVRVSSEKETEAVGDRTDLLRTMKKVVSPDTVYSPAEFRSALQSPFRPVGPVIYDYCVSNTRYEVYRNQVSDPVVKTFCSRLQPFILFYLEAGSFISVDDERWLIYSVYSKSEDADPEYALIGFCTVYMYYVFPDKERDKISQFVILPPSQNQGHGGKLLSAIYEDSAKRGALEVNVEDPSLDFTFLRNLTDFRNCLKVKIFSTPEFEDCDAFASLDFRKKVLDVLHINDFQARICFEIYNLHLVEEKNEEQMRKYRLSVKRRVLKQREEILSLAPTPAEKKSKLNEMYEEAVTQYRLILRLSGLRPQ